MDGCRIVVLNGLFSMSGGIRLIPHQSLAMRGAASIEGSGALWGLEGGYSFWLAVMGQIGWNPVSFGGQVDIGGGAWVSAFGARLGASVSAHLELRFAKPKLLALSVELSADLPWPLPKPRIGLTVFRLVDDAVDAPLAALTLAAITAIGLLHRSNGTFDQFRNDGDAILPDDSFELPFRAICGGSPLVVNRTPGDGRRMEGSVSVTHQLLELRIMKVDEITSTEVAVPDVSAAWLGTNVAGSTERTSRLAIPCNDPLAWLQTFDYAQPGTALPRNITVFQTFGSGPNQMFRATLGNAKFNVEHVHISSPTSFLLLNLPWVTPYTRAISVREFSVAVADHLNPVPVRQFDLRFIGGREPGLHVDHGILSIFRVRDLGNDRYEWSAIVTRDVADERRPLAVGSGEVPIHLVAVGYIINGAAGLEPGHETVFRPGLYKLYVRGTSTASYGGNNAPTSWTPLVKRFRVISPPSLRPYIRYATFGDERAFGVAHGGWNPNPRGSGFGHYRRHKGVIRFRVGYFSKIHDRLWIANDTGMQPVEVRVTVNTHGVPSSGRLSQEWRNIVGLANTPEEELLFDLPSAPGAYVVHTYKSDRGDGTDLIGNDSWSYRVSAYDLPRDHIKPANTLARAYGPFGIKAMSVGPTTDVPIGFDFDSVPEAPLSTTWPLPPWIRQEPDLSSTDAGLVFLRIFEWARFFDAPPSPTPEERLFHRPTTPDISLVMDTTGTPFALLLRTAEPCDWRRVEVTLVHGQNAPERRFSTRLVPSPDGCACLLLISTSGVPIRIPRGTFAARVRYHYRWGDLASLIDRTDLAQLSDDFTFTFTQPLGRIWNV